MAQLDATWINVGALRGPHGLKGHMKAKVDLDDVTLLQSAGPVRLADGRQLTVTDIKAVGQGLWALLVEGITTPEAAEAYRGQALFLDREAFPEAEGEVYLDTLIGQPVSGPEGAPLGTVAAVVELPAGPALEIALLTEGAKPALVPVEDAFWDTLTPPTLTAFGVTLLAL